MFPDVFPVSCCFMQLKLPRFGAAHQSVCPLQLLDRGELSKVTFGGGGRSGWPQIRRHANLKQCKHKKGWLVDLVKGRKGTILHCVISYRPIAIIVSHCGNPYYYYRTSTTEWHRVF